MNSKAFLIVALFALTVLSDNCGGNCPSGKCINCPCGNKKDYPDLNEVCDGIAWDSNCCKCIILRISLGNTNFAQPIKSGMEPTGAGLLGAGRGLCEYQPEDLCYWPHSKECMVDRWEEYEDFRAFPKEAKACGCDTFSKKLEVE